VCCIIAGCGEQPRYEQASDSAPVEPNASTAIEPGVAEDQRTSDIEGVYVTAVEISGLSGTVLQLDRGRFKYWFYSDVVGPREPEYPITGDYTLTNWTLRLGNREVTQRIWYPDFINGVRVLLREDALIAWRTRKRLYDYGILIHAGTDIDGESTEHPSIQILYDDEMKERIKDWKDPFVHGSQ
jgi:hypothetical protein